MEGVSSALERIEASSLTVPVLEAGSLLVLSGFLEDIVTGEMFWQLATNRVFQRACGVKTGLYVRGLFRCVCFDRLLKAFCLGRRIVDWDASCDTVGVGPRDTARGWAQ